MGKGGGYGEGQGAGKGSGSGQGSGEDYKGKTERLAVPAMPAPVAVLCCVLNFLIPGFGEYSLPDRVQVVTLTNVPCIKTFWMHQYNNRTIKFGHSGTLR